MTCTETFSAAERPQLVEKFPDRATAGHVAELTLEIRHLPGEAVLPAGLQLTEDSAEGKELVAAHFRWPAPQSAVQPSVVRASGEDAERVVTTIRIPFVPLPPEPGRVELHLPALPIAVARASGKLEELCTSPHTLIVEDALANSPNAPAKPDPEPRPQREVWVTARDVTLGALAALPLILLALWALKRARARWKKRQKPVRVVPPWEAALAALTTLDGEGLLDREQYEAYLDRVSDTLRDYLGARYGFDGLESTTHETLRQLTARAPHFEFEREVRTILQRADLVKFARRLPELDECRDAMTQTRQIVQRTTPSPTLDPRPATAAPAGAP
ncbi:MAG TPA: hypothetical protein VLC09_05745 [Polyangiaceae bacterium]|nr:hypothetical protein [Polyangiaceae bacterium]